MATPQRLVLLGASLALALAVLLYLLTRPAVSGSAAVGPGGAGVEPPGAHAPATRPAEAPAPNVIVPGRAVDEPPESAPSRPAARTGIRGKVATKDGVPIAGARIAIEPAIDYARDRISRGEAWTKILPSFAEGVSDAAGIFEIVPLPPRSYAVVCDQDGFGAERIEAVEVLRDRVTPVDVALAPARELPGEVVDASGAPVAGAEVFVESLGLKRLVADERGRFRVTLPGTPPSDTWTIRAVKEGVGVGSEAFPLGAELPATVRINLFRARRLTCRFQPDDGTPPPAGLRFSVATFILPRYFTFVGTTDPSGVGMISVLPEVDQISVITDDPVWALPSPGGRSNANVITGVERTIVPLGDVSIEVPVTRTGTLSGSVVDRASGKPVPGVPIQASARGSQPIPFGRHAQRTVVTDERGDFRIEGLQRAETGLTIQSTRWLLWPDGWNGEPIPMRGGFDRAKFFGQHPLNQSPSVTGIVVKVVAAGTVEGVVVDAAGAPIDAAEVDAGIETVDPRSQFAIEGRHYREDFATRADQAGRFALMGVYPSASCRIRARRPNTPWSWSEPFDLAPGATKRDLRISLPTGKTLVVSVVRPDGSPVAGAAVSIAEGDASTGGADRVLPGARRAYFRRRTAKDGSATFIALTADRITWVVDPDTLPDGLMTAEGLSRSVAIGDAAPNRLTINLQPAPLLKGKVQLEDGSPLGPASVTAVPVGDASPDGQALGSVSADGSFSIRVTSSRPHSIRDVFRTTYIPHAVGVSTDQRMEKFVPAKPHELRPGEPAVVVLKKG